MSRRRRPSISPNLFPFLAVLVCTLGTLILLLALVSQDASDSARALVEKETGTAKLIAEEERWEAEKLIAYRSQQTAELEQKRSELAHLEDHSRRIREELEQLQQEITVAHQDQDETSNNEVRTKLASMKIRAEREKDEIAKLKTERDGRPPRVVIVPYKGTSGTDRRPIYLECTATAVILQPEGIRITAEQLDGPMGPGNPLDAALRAVRSHWQKQDPTAAPPYPLLLVRPSGIHAYAAARVAMSTWDEHFGYELITEDLELAFPKKDITLEVLVLNAVRDAVTRGRAQIAAAPSRYPRFAANGKPSASARNGNQFGSGDGTGDGESGGNGGNANSGSRMGSGTIASNGAGFGAGRGPQTTGRFGGSNEAPNSGGDGIWNGDANNGFASDSGTAPGSGTGNFTIDGKDLAAKNRGGTGSAGQSDAGSGTGSTSDSMASSVAGETATGDSPSGDNPSGEAGGQGASGQIGATGSGSSSAAPANGQAAAMAADPGRPSGAMQNSQPFDPHEKTFSETMRERSQSRPGKTSNQPPGSEPVLRAGNNWALPESMLNRNGTAIVRQMELSCSRNQYVLLPETERDQARVFEIQNGDVEPTVIELATAIRDRVESWGLALQNGRWEPVLVVRVDAGADARFEELRGMLRGSGVRVERETR